MTSEGASARERWIAFFGTYFLRALALTWRVRWLNRDVETAARTGAGHAKQPVVFVLWHGELLPLIWVHRGRDIAIMVSEHRDGELIARVAAAIGFRLVRGSTSHGAARALLGGTREIGAGFDVAVTVDGPRGPAGSVAAGALVISQRTGVSMLPVSASADRAWRLRSWDRFLIPKPFARLYVAYGEPVRVSSETARDAVAEAARVRDAINGAQAIVRRASGEPLTDAS